MNTGRRLWLADAAVALSLANLCLLHVWRELLFASEEDRYWMIDFDGRHFAAGIFNMIWIATAIYAGIQAFRRWRNPSFRLSLAAGLLVLLAVPLNYARMAFKFNERELFALIGDWTLAAPALLAAALLAAAIMWRPLRALRGLYVALLLVSPFAALNLLNAGWALLNGVTAQESPSVAQRGPSDLGARGARVALFIFDELDWRLVYEQRPPGVRLPQLTRLAEQAVVAAALEPTSATLRAIPALTTGRVPKSVYRIDGSRLALDFVGTGATGTWSETPNVFSDARELGLRTGIVGFYHPYCRIFLGYHVLCNAYPLDVTHMDPRDTFVEIVGGQLGRMSPVARRTAAIGMFQRLSEQTRAALADPGLDFVFAHLSVPHGPNIWDAEAGRFTAFNFRKDGYYDNLELADRLLGELRSELEASGLWEETALVVTADHGWRHVDLVGGPRDYRVPLIVKFPGQTGRLEVTNVVAAADVVRPIVRGLLSGELSEAGELKIWLERHPPANKT